MLPAVNSFGTSCVGSGGANVLAELSLPWLGTVFRSEATGMPQSGFAVRVLGFSPALLPLSTVLPQGQIGCALYVSPEDLDLRVPMAGRVTQTLAIPNMPGLAGQIVHEQIVPFELDPQGRIVSLTSTNRLTLVLGSF